MAVLMSSTSMHYSAFGQFPTTLEEPTTEATTTDNLGQTDTGNEAEGGASYYTDPSKGFRVQVPDGWVVDNINETDPSVNERTIPDYGMEFLISMCPQQLALPAVGGIYYCPFPLPQLNTSAAFQLYRFIDLYTRPELSALLQENKSITTSDLLALFINHQRNAVITDPTMRQSIQIATNEDVQVNVIDPTTNETVGSVPAKFAEFTYTDAYGYTYIESVLLVLSSDTNTGYVVRPYVYREGIQELPDFTRQVIDSFALLVPTDGNSTPESSAPTSSAVGTTNVGETDQPSSEVRMHIEEARLAAQSGDNQGVLMHLDLALNALDG